MNASIRRGLLGISAVLVSSILAVSVAAAAEDRRGSDDLFIMVDTSAPSGRTLGGLKRLLEEVTLRWARNGDRVVLMTFDSEARLRAVLPIVDRRRDGELLRDVIDGIDTTRVVRYDGFYPKLVESPDGAVIGGAAWSDYCEMWRLTSAVMRRYREPGRRQSFLLVTGSAPAAPPYRACAEPSPPLDITAAVREGRLPMTVVALALTADTAATYAAHVAEVLQMRVIPLSGDVASVDVVRSVVLDSISSRVELVDPAAIVVPPQFGDDVQFIATVANHAHDIRRIAIRGATLDISGRPPIRVNVVPATLTLNPGDRKILILSASGVLRTPGTCRGSLTFGFGPGSGFEPSTLVFSATKADWLETLGNARVFVAAALTFLSAIIVIASRHRRRNSVQKAV